MDINVDIIGLQATLQLLQQYRQDGVLRADVGHAFRRPGPCIAYIVISQGEIVSCYVEDKSAQHQPMNIEVLLRMDSDEGPFAWRFAFQQGSKEAGQAKAQISPPQKRQRPDESSMPIPSRGQESSFKTQQLIPSAIPRRIANLDLSWLTTWSPQQKRILRMVYGMVDGQRTVAMIENTVLSSKATVQEALIVLVAIQVITLNSNQ